MAKPVDPRTAAFKKLQSAPTAKATVQKRLSNEEIAMNKLMAERQAYSQKYGSWPTDEQLMASRARKKNVL